MALVHGYFQLVYDFFCVFYEAVVELAADGTGAVAFCYVAWTVDLVAEGAWYTTTGFKNDRGPLSSTFVIFASL